MNSVSVKQSLNEWVCFSVVNLSFVIGAVSGELRRVEEKYLSSPKDTRMGSPGHQMLAMHKRLADGHLRSCSRTTC